MVVVSNREHAQIKTNNFFFFFFNKLYLKNIKLILFTKTNCVCVRERVLLCTIESICVRAKFLPANSIFSCPVCCFSASSPYRSTWRSGVLSFLVSLSAPIWLRSKTSPLRSCCLLRTSQTAVCSSCVRTFARPPLILLYDPEYRFCYPLKKNRKDVFDWITRNDSGY